jgi:hypothetical protein
MRLLILDIETAPNVSYAWDTWNTTLGSHLLITSKHMMCFAAKFVGEEKVYFYSEYHHGTDKMVKGLHKLLDQADAVIHYNGKKFDMPHCNTEMLKLGLQPPSPYKQIDLYQVISKNFELTYNSLDFVLKTLGYEGKVSTGGFDLWLLCMAGNKKAWARMKEYNIGDVVKLEPLYFNLLPWIPSHPSWGAHTGEDVCPNCGSSNLVREGYAYTAMGQFQRFHCGDCGRWSRSNKRIGGTRVANIAASG